MKEKLKRKKYKEELEQLENKLKYENEKNKN